MVLLGWSETARESQKWSDLKVTLTSRKYNKINNVTKYQATSLDTVHPRVDKFKFKKKIVRKKYNLTFLHLELRGRDNPTHLSGQCKGDKSNPKMVVGVLLDVTMEKKENVFHYRFEGSVSRRKA